MPRADASRRRCAIYTRKSSEEGLEQEFNSLAAQREACEAYIRSQQHEGWLLARNRYDDGGFSGGNLERPAAHVILHRDQGLAVARAGPAGDPQHARHRRPVNIGVEDSDTQSLAASQKVASRGFWCPRTRR